MRYMDVGAAATAAGGRPAQALAKDARAGARGIREAASAQGAAQSGASNANRF